MSDQENDTSKEILRDISEKHVDQPGDLGPTQTDTSPPTPGPPKDESDD